MMDDILFGCAYYKEYMPYERLDKDMMMIRDACMNTIRIAESTLSNEEPEDGVFDFASITRTIEAAEKNELYVIIGTPTYAIPPWLAAKHPEIIADTGCGREKYGRRQNMDITSPAYLYHAERIIRKLMEATLEYPNVIGVQLDNETKHYHTCGHNVQHQFIRYLRNTFGTTEAMNRAFGFNYWSNRVDSWENVPDVTGSINGSFKAEFEKYKRSLVTEYLLWQSSIVREYLHDGQFITHNFDYEWRGYSFGIQPDVNHKHASDAITLTGCDIYHPTQEKLSGAEIAFCGAIAYGLKRSNYLVLETQAQGQTQWLPYEGQLRLHAFSHLAAGSAGVMYWHWHSIHHSYETYWKGILSHDMEPNEAYSEICSVSRDLIKIDRCIGKLRKSNNVAILVNNDSLTGMQMFPIPDTSTNYNDYVRWVYDALYEINVEADVIFPEDYENFDQYKMLLTPTLYSVSDSLIEKLKRYVENGGYLVSTFKSGFTNEYLEVRNTRQPHPQCFGINYNLFTKPENVFLVGNGFPDDSKAEHWMEMLNADTAEVLAMYNHPAWGKYAGVTKTKFGKGTSIYIGCYMEKAVIKKLLFNSLDEAGIMTKLQQIQFPIVIRSGLSKNGHTVHYYMNYSGSKCNLEFVHSNAIELLSDMKYMSGETVILLPWEVKIFVIYS